MRNLIEVGNENLEEILENLNFIPLEKTAVHTPTQEAYNELMRVYETGRWFWHGGSPPTNLNLWYIYKEQICFEAKSTFLHKYKDICLARDLNVLSTQEFYEKQKITPKMLKEINEYFEGRK